MLEIAVRRADNNLHRFLEFPAIMSKPGNRMERAAGAHWGHSFGIREEFYSWYGGCG